MRLQRFHPAFHLEHLDQQLGRNKWGRKDGMKIVDPGASSPHLLQLLRLSMPLLSLLPKKWLSGQRSEPFFGGTSAKST